MVIAKVKTFEAGYDSQKEKMKELFELNQELEVDDIDMGQSSTSIYLKGYDRSFNSVFFDFYEDGKELNIFNDERFNPYL